MKILGIVIEKLKNLLLFVGEKLKWFYEACKDLVLCAIDKIVSFFKRVFKSDRNEMNGNNYIEMKSVSLQSNYSRVNKTLNNPKSQKRISQKEAKELLDLLEAIDKINSLY